MKTVTPTVSVIMPVYNADDFLAEAIESVLDQTYCDFELIIVCDNPSEKTYQILNSFQKLDRRIIVYINENKGLSESRNFGCSVAKGEFIAWIDADDICLPNRLEIQISFLDKHQDIGICGSQIRVINGEKEESVHLPLTDQEIRYAMLFSSPFANSSVIMRKKIISYFDKLYNPEYKLAEDYDLWVRCMKYTHFANVNSELVKYRVHPNSISQIRKEDMQEFAIKVSQTALSSTLKHEIPLNNVKIIYRQSNNFSTEEYITTTKNLRQLQHLYLENPALSHEERQYIKKSMCIILKKIGMLPIRKNPILSLYIFALSFMSEPIFFIKRFVYYILNGKLLKKGL